MSSLEERRQDSTRTQTPRTTSPEPPEYCYTHLDTPIPFHVDPPPSYDEASRDLSDRALGCASRVNQEEDGTGTPSVSGAGPTGPSRWHRLRNISSRAQNKGRSKVGLLTAAVALVTRRVTLSASVAVGNTSVSDSAQRECVACQDPIQGARIRAPCGHFYDLECVLKLFEVSMRSEQDFPPRCCQREIPLSSVRSYMERDVRRSYKLKHSEFKTKKRVHCANPQCGRFLGPERSHALSGYRKTCAACATVTCTRCRRRADPVQTEQGAVRKHRCESYIDPDAQRVLRMGHSAGWARCPGCKQLVERNGGCLHITCRCGTQFCYRCSRRWWICKARCRPGQFEPLRVRGASSDGHEEPVDPPRNVGRWRVRHTAMEPAMGSPLPEEPIVLLPSFSYAQHLAQVVVSCRRITLYVSFALLLLCIFHE